MTRGNGQKRPREEFERAVHAAGQVVADHPAGVGIGAVVGLAGGVALLGGALLVGPLAAGAAAGLGLFAVGNAVVNFLHPAQAPALVQPQAAILPIGVAVQAAPAPAQMTSVHKEEKMVIPEGFTDVPGDGHCFYHAIMAQLINVQGIEQLVNAAELQLIAINEIFQNQELYFPFLAGFVDQIENLQNLIDRGDHAGAIIAYVDHHIWRPQDQGINTWADNIIIQALSNAMHITINTQMFHLDGTQILLPTGTHNVNVIAPTNGVSAATITIANIGHHHFASHAASVLQHNTELPALNTWLGSEEHAQVQLAKETSGLGKTQLASFIDQSKSVHAQMKEIERDKGRPKTREEMERYVKLITEAQRLEKLIRDEGNEPDRGPVTNRDDQDGPDGGGDSLGGVGSGSVQVSYLTSVIPEQSTKKDGEADGETLKSKKAPEVEWPQVVSCMSFDDDGALSEPYATASPNLEAFLILKPTPFELMGMQISPHQC